MTTKKWHALDHICDKIRKMGDMAYFHVGLFESSHKRFKRKYSFSSKRARTVMEEFLEIDNRRRAVTDLAQNRIENYRNLSLTRANAVKEKGACLVKIGSIIATGGIESVLQRSKTMWGCLDMGNTDKGSEKKPACLAGE